MKKLSKKTIKRIVLAASLLLAVVLIFVFRASIIPGWYEENGERYYLESPFKRASDIATVGRKTYIFSDYGSHALTKGWQKIDGFRYYAYENGEMATGEQEIDGEMYFFQRDGVMYCNESRIIDGKLWYFNDHGFTVSGIVEIDGYKYCYSENGNLKKGLVEIDGKKYYFNPGGTHDKEAMMYGFITVGTNTYYFGSDGAAVTGETVIDGTYYNFDDEGRLIS
ncbi:MAG: hypothetical protein IJ404_04960 [Clostridia bacterium]|nr:hypothetical protein [Clostridia bacterium]